MNCIKSAENENNLGVSGKFEAFAPSGKDVDEKEEKANEK